MDCDTSGYTQVTTTRPRAVAFLPTTILASVLRVSYRDLILKLAVKVMDLFVSVDKEFLFLRRHLWAAHSILWLDQKYLNTQVRVNVWPQVCESLRLRPRRGRCRSCPYVFLPITRSPSFLPPPWRSMVWVLFSLPVCHEVISWTHRPGSGRSRTEVYVLCCLVDRGAQVAAAEGFLRTFSIHIWQQKVLQVFSLLLFYLEGLLGFWKCEFSWK